MKKIRSYLPLCFAFLIGMGVMYIVQNYDRYAQELSIREVLAAQNSTQVDLAPVEQVYELISSYYFKEVNKDELVNGAIKGMVEQLNDPHSFYMDQETTQQFLNSVDSVFEGIGTEISVEDGKFYIIAPIKNSPAEKAGLKPRDQIIKVDGQLLEGLTQAEVIAKIRGKKGTNVTLQILREGVSEPISVQMVRDVINQVTVEDKVTEKSGKKIVTLHITTFGESTAKEFSALLEQYESEGMDGLIIDVRGNPGGYLSSVENILNLLVSNEKPKIMIEDRSGQRQQSFSNLQSKKSYPISVLIDEGSASASEILAAALKEIGNYPVIGVASYGKGTVQQALSLKNGNTLKLTTSKWLTPNGNWIDQKGVQPTIEVQQPAYFYYVPLTLDKNENLTLDMNSEKIKIAQQYLQALGFHPKRMDGYFNEDTQSAVKQFQQSENLQVTGIIDETTASKMYQKLVTLVKNEKNDLQLQRAIQQMLK